MMKEEINPQIRSEDVHDLIPYLPSEIMLNILLRIPTRTVMRCKCVCKAWRDLLDTPEFVQSHLSKSVPGLAVYLSGENSKPYRIVEFGDEHRLNTVFSFDLPFISCYDRVHSSANGLLFVCKQNQYENPLDLFICNPITREYITIPSPRKAYFRRAINYGFGVSKMSGQYKVVRFSLRAADCQVYSVGTGLWRRIEFDRQLRYKRNAVGAFLNGNLHWLSCNEDLSFRISCFDLETECFSTFSPPHRRADSRLYVLGDYLCVCYTFARRGGVFDIEFWLMKEYGDEKSWTKEFHFDTGYCDVYCPIKVFNDTDVLMQLGSSKLLYYSKKHDRLEIIREDDRSSCATIYVPSFLRLKSFAMENVTTF